MKLHFVLLVLIVISIIHCSQSKGPTKNRNTKKPIHRPPHRSNGRPEKRSHNVPRQSKSHTSQRSSKGSQKPVARTDSQSTRVNTRGVGSAIGSVVGGVTPKAKQVVVLIKCVIKCGVKYTRNVKICSGMFQCLYDCFIGQEYIPSDVQKEMDKYEGGGSASYPSGISLNSIFNQLKCVYKCTTDHPIRNWETFVYVLYCFAESCICYQIFGG